MVLGVFFSFVNIFLSGEALHRNSPSFLGGVGWFLVNLLAFFFSLDILWVPQKDKKLSRKCQKCTAKPAVEDRDMTTRPVDRLVELRDHLPPWLKPLEIMVAQFVFQRSWGEVLGSGSKHSKSTFFGDD